MCNFRIRFMLTLTVVILSASITWADASKVSIAVSQTPLSLPFFVADSQGFFDDENVDVVFEPVIGGHRAYLKVVEGEADMGTSSDAVVMFNATPNSNFSLVSTFVHSNEDVKLVSLKSSGITNTSQLAGKTVGTVMGSAAHYFLDVSLLLNGVDASQVNVISLQPEQMPDALQSGAVDAVSIWEPWPFKILEISDDAGLIQNLSGYQLTFNLLVNNNFIETHEAELVKVLRALKRSQDFIANKPQEAKDILKQSLSLGPTFIEWIWSSFHYQLELNQSLIVTLEQEAFWAKSRGFIKSSRPIINYLNVIDGRFLRQVSPESVSLIE